MEETMKNSATTMLTCSSACAHTINYCLDKGGEHASKAHINLLLDCAKICELAANFTARSSEHLTAVSKLCAEVCDRCAEECARMGEDDEMMQHCAEMCRRCAEECRTMAAM